jgi:hypothetical protein
MCRGLGQGIIGYRDGIETGGRGGLRGVAGKQCEGMIGPGREGEIPTVIGQIRVRFGGPTLGPNLQRVAVTL